MLGCLGLIASNQYATACDKWDNVCGSGLFMESIIQNPVFYELTFEMPLHAGKVNLEEWLAVMRHAVMAHLPRKQHRHGCIFSKVLIKKERTVRNAVLSLLPVRR